MEAPVNIPGLGALRRGFRTVSPGHVMHHPLFSSLTLERRGVCPLYANGAPSGSGSVGIRAKPKNLNHRDTEARRGKQEQRTQNSPSSPVALSSVLILGVSVALWFHSSANA